MVETIKKRNGVVVAFDAQKIYNAIFKANIRIADEKLTEQQLNALTKEIVSTFQTTQDVPTVEQIQDAVEEHLITHGYAKTAKAYILYRAEHAKMREMDENLMKIYEDLTFKPSEEADIKRENANIDADTAMGTMLKYGSEGAKCFYDAYVIPSEMAEAHRHGDIHIHDKDFYALTETCCQIDLIKLFKDGFSTGHGFLREPNDIRSYTALACIAIQANQNEMHGGQSVPNFDYAMALGVAKTFRKCYFKSLAQALQIQKGLNKAEATQLAKTIQNEIGTDITMGTTAAFETALKEYFSNKPNLAVTEQEAEKMHSYAVETAMDDTNDATYQAMEALIHNLNTMNSQCRCTSTVQLFKLWYRYFPRRPYGYEKYPSGNRKRILGSGETAIFPIQIFKVKEGVSYHRENSRTMTYSSYPFVFPQNVFSLTLALLMLRLIYNIIKRDILRLKLHIWAAVPE